MEQTGNDVFVERRLIENEYIDIGGRDLVIGIGEPALRLSGKGGGKLDAKLNARLAAYILPAVQLARKQVKRPRFILVNGINFALLWNARSEEERKIMVVNNSMKVDFLQAFISEFFPEVFSVFDHIISQDILKVPEHKLLQLWSLLERKYPEEAGDILDDLKRFARISDDDEVALHRAIAYAVGHLFGTGDVNFEGNYVHNPVGYASIGGDREEVFNRLRGLILPIVRDFSEIIFDRKTVVKDNMRIVIRTEERIPPPYNGFFTKSGAGRSILAEVTYENGKDLSFYEEHGRLHEDIEYIYSLVGKEEYIQFWNDYHSRYEELTSRYREAYGIVEPV